VAKSKVKTYGPTAGRRRPNVDGHGLGRAILTARNPKTSAREREGRRPWARARLTHLGRRSRALAAATTWAFGSLLFRRLLRRETRRAPPSPGRAEHLAKNSLAVLVLGALWLLDRARSCPRASPIPLARSAAASWASRSATRSTIAALPRAGVQRRAMVVLLQVPLALVLAFGLFGNRLVGPHRAGHGGRESRACCWCARPDATRAAQARGTAPRRAAGHRSRRWPMGSTSC